MYYEQKDATVHLIELIKKNRISPKVIINGSAIGYYGPSKTNTYGAWAGIIVGFFLRLGGGEATIGLPAFLPYPMIEEGVVLFPFRTLAMICSLLTILIVSALTQKASPPRPLLMPDERTGNTAK